MSLVPAPPSPFGSSRRRTWSYPNRPKTTTQPDPNAGRLEGDPAATAEPEPKTQFTPLTVVATGVKDRSATNRVNIEETLARIKSAAE